MSMGQMPGGQMYEGQMSVGQMPVGKMFLPRRHRIVKNVTAATIK